MFAQRFCQELQKELASAKEKAQARKLIERQVPREMLFANSGGRQGWPSFQPSMVQCQILASVRRGLVNLMGHEITRPSRQDIKYINAPEIYDRYAQLLEQRKTQLARKAKRHASSHRKSDLESTIHLVSFQPVQHNHSAATITSPPLQAALF